jgi:hypothetical protein
MADSRSSAHEEVPHEHIASRNPSCELSNVDADRALAGYDAPENYCTAVSTQTAGAPTDQPETTTLADIVQEECETSDEWYLPISSRASAQVHSAHSGHPQNQPAGEPTTAEPDPAAAAVEV